LCGSKRVYVVKCVKSPHVDYLYSLYECKECKCRFFDAQEHTVSISGIYEKLVENKIPEVEFRRSKYWTNQTKRIMKSLGKKPESLLDVGCGTGDFLMHWDDVVKEGVELSRAKAQFARERGLRIYNDYFENVEFNKKYTVVTCYAFVEHLVNPIMALNKLMPIVVIGGILVIMLPTYECLKRWVINTFTPIRWHMYSPPEHLNFFSKQFLDRYLAKNSFKLVDRYWTSGGMFNPFRNIPFANRVFGKGMTFLEEYTPINKLPIFDHLYSYYVKTR